MTEAFDQEIVHFIETNKILEALHFTTSRGLLGVLRSQAVLCRDQLPENKHIEYIYTPNCVNRLKDAAWTSYVNLSISVVNKGMLDTSNRWHPPTEDLFWVVLAFDPAIMALPGVVFTTTNNTYPTVTRRAGLAGLESLFAHRVPWGYYGAVHCRSASTPSSLTTDPQAEVLFPGQVPLSYLRAVYVLDEDQIDWVQSVIEMLSPSTTAQVVHSPEVFG